MNTSKIAFVEWSKAITGEDYDVSYVISLLGRFNGRPINGLDVGGGIGTFASQVCQKVPDCHIGIVDKSSLAKENFISNRAIHFVYKNFFEIEENRRYDFIIGSEVFQVGSQC